MLNILLPSLPYQRVTDPMWEEEMAVARARGYTVCLFDDLQGKLLQQPNARQPTLYRGWMLSSVEYARLVALTPLLVPMEMYLASHQASGWIDAIAGHTPKSKVVAAGAAEPVLESFLAVNDRCFVKGLSKSFGADSVLTSLEGFRKLLSQQAIESQELLILREFVELADQPEQRFFAVRDQAFGAERQLFPPELMPALLALQDRWFYTIDIAYTSSGKPIIIEVGDGQVSDTKEWRVAELYRTAVAILADSLKAFSRL